MSTLFVPRNLQDAGAEKLMGVMTWFARLLLVVTSVAPILIVYAAVLMGGGKVLQACIMLLLAIGLAALCFGLLKLARGTDADMRTVKAPTERDGDALAFLVAYALPLATAKLQDAPRPYGLIAFAVVMTALVWQQQIFHVNPLLGLKYHFFSAQTDDDTKILVLTTSKTLKAGDLPIVKLSEYLWLHCP